LWKSNNFFPKIHCMWYKGMLTFRVKTRCSIASLDIPCLWCVALLHMWDGMPTFRVRTSVGRFFGILKNRQFRFFKCSRLKELLVLSFFLSFNLTSIPGPERSIWRLLPSWFEQNTPVLWKNSESKNCWFWLNLKEPTVCMKN